MATERLSQLVWYTLLVVVVTLASEDPVVKVQQGLLKGKTITSIGSKKEYHGFSGIPYAKPPLGDLKFKAPEAPELWTGTRDAITEGNVCTQRSDITKSLLGDDDCLYLNVYTPELPNENGDKLKPVMFFIHGGGFYFGSGSSRVFGADYLVDEGVVLVTINYRLGPQGFLSLENAEVPGNAGLKDQVFALRWVRDNIKEFGGDPDKVTIFGQSAGGASVQYHILSPMSKGLFHRAISMSGSSLNPWSFKNSSREYAFRLGERLGLKTEDPQELVKFLRQVEPLELTKASHEVLTPEEKPVFFGFPFLPTLDVESDGEVFLSAHPKQLLKSGDLNDVPYINGIVSDEGILAINVLNEAPEDAIGLLNKEFERAIPLDFPVDRKSDQGKEVANKIRHFYFGDKPLFDETMPQFYDMISDEWFFKDINAALEEISERYKNPIYFYQFSFTGQFGIIKRLLGAEAIPGVAHGDDLGYLFRMLLTSRITLPPEDPSMITLARMVKMWTNFAKTGNPTPEKDSVLNVTWPVYTKENHTYLDIDKDLTIKQHFSKDRIQFWKDLYSGTVSSD